MRRESCILLLAGLLLGSGSLFTVDSDAAPTPSKAKTTAARKPATPTQLSTAAVDRSKEADYKAAKSKAQAQYRKTAAKCRKRSTKAIPGCMSDARAVRDEELAQAKMRWGTPQ